MSVDIRTEIEKANVKLSESLKKGDAATAASLYTRDAILLPPNMGKVQGREAVKEFWGGAIAQLGLKDAVLKVEELTGSGDTYTEVGSYVMKLQTEGQEPTEDRGKYVVVWKHTDDGWKLHRDIWNSDLQPT
jgi:ketosteroid isomerase-like protein